MPLVKKGSPLKKGSRRFVAKKKKKKKDNRSNKNKRQFRRKFA